MATETERKFLVRGEFRHDAVKSIDILQRYLSVDPLKTIRIRIADDEAFLTVKSPGKTGAIARGEWEFAIPVDDAKDLMEICLPGSVVKTRYIVPAGRRKFEVDVFHDKNEGLVIAEIELGSEDEEFKKPGWLGDEVTGDPRYYSSALIK
jgi:adenylate cyclase